MARIIWKVSVSLGNTERRLSQRQVYREDGKTKENTSAGGGHAKDTTIFAYSIQGWHDSRFFALRSGVSHHEKIRENSYEEGLLPPNTLVVGIEYDLGGVELR